MQTRAWVVSRAPVALRRRRGATASPVRRYGRFLHAGVRLRERNAPVRVHCTGSLSNGRSGGDALPLDSIRDADSSFDEEEEEQETPEEESLRVLEWTALCRQVSQDAGDALQDAEVRGAQVACFASTPMAAEEILSQGLHRSHSFEETELLLQQTSEALAVDLKSTLPCKALREVEWCV